MSQILVERVGGYSNKLRKIRLVLDGREIDRLVEGEKKTIAIAPGKHTLQAQIDWCGSNKIEFSLKEGETKDFSLMGTSPMLALYHILFDWNGYLILEEMGT